MGKKTSKKRLNTLPIKQFQPDKPKQVNIVPRNVTQESYLLKLLDPSKDIVFGVGPAGTGKTLIAVQVAIKMFKEKSCILMKYIPHLYVLVFLVYNLLYGIIF